MTNSRTFFYTCCILQIHRWGFDIDGLDKATKGRPLTHVFIAALRQLNLVEEFNLQQDKLLHFVLDVERQYPDNPFHNRKHAAEVVQAVASALLTVSTRFYSIASCTRMTVDLTL
jgi:hypothetical protein